MKLRCIPQTLLLPLFLVVLTAGLSRQARADQSAMVGTWDCVSETPDGDDFKFVLTVKELDGKLVATAGTDDGDMPIADIQSEGDDLTFKATVNDQEYTVKVKVNGAAFEGKWSGGDDSGSVKGTKRA